MTISIVFSSTETAPLHAHYDGQLQPQPAYISLDVESGVVDADYSGDVGNAVPVRVWHGIERRYPIRSDLTTEQVRGVIASVTPLLERIHAGAAVEWDGSNWVARLSDDAQDAEDELERQEPLGGELESLVITDLAGWLLAGMLVTELMPAEGESVAEYIQGFDLDGYQCAEDLGDVLTKIWADHLYGGSPLPQGVARHLLDGGNCAGSAWIKELAAYAEGRDPSDD